MEESVATVKGQMKFKEILWDGGTDWADGYLISSSNGRQRFVTIKCSDHFQNLFFDGELNFRSVPISNETLNKPAEERLAEIKRLAEKQLKEYVYSTYFEFTSE
jgi:hypothetical protein